MYIKLPDLQNKNEISYEQKREKYFFFQNSEKTLID